MELTSLVALRSRWRSFFPFHRVDSRWLYGFVNRPRSSEPLLTRHSSSQPSTLWHTSGWPSLIPVGEGSLMIERLLSDGQRKRLSNTPVPVAAPEGQGMS